MDKEIIRAAQLGHNLTILGQAGTGKSSLIKQIAQLLRSKQKKVQITASTGLAASSLNGLTLHTFCGLQDGRYSEDEIVRKILSGVDARKIKENITNTDVLIIDEISMVSRKIFLQIDGIFRRIRRVPDLPFGGIQMILSGDFYQLKPVPNEVSRDPGELLITDSEEFKSLIPHHFILERVHRQSEGNTSQPTTHN